MRSVGYHVAEPYPAEKVLDLISKRLGDAGWKPLPMDWLNPTIPSSHSRGWTYFLDGTANPGRQVNQWLAQWQDPAGNVVVYALRYSYPLPEGKEPHPHTPSNTDLEVHAALVSKDVAESAMRDAASPGR
jgi:hypothetical protein